MYAALSDQLVGTAVQRLHFISCADSWTEKNHGEWIMNQDLMAGEGKKNKQKKQLPVKLWMTFTLQP